MNEDKPKCTSPRADECMGLLARLDERSRQTANDINEIKLAMLHNFVTKTEFNPVRTIVFSLVGLLCSSVVVAVIALVVKK